MIAFMFICSVCIFGLLLSGCKKDEEEPTNEPEKQEEEEEEDEEEEDAEAEEEEDTVNADFSKFSTETQKVGSSSDDAEYTLASILDTEMNGYHRFQFTLESDEEELPEIEAQLISSGGFIRVRLDRVTSDQSGIIYQGSRDIGEDGIVSIYHAVTPVATEEIYQIGIVEDTEFYLHEGDGLSVLLDVKYSGEVADDDETDDPGDFSSGTVKLTGTNTVGDARFVAYSWSTEPSVLKFIWSTSSASGNPTPPTEAKYDASAKKITVTFTELQGDSVIGSDGEFQSDLTTVVNQVTGERTGTTSTYVFELNKDTTYKIYRNASPNQVVLEVKK